MSIIYFFFFLLPVPSQTDLQLKYCINSRLRVTYFRQKPFSVFNIGEISRISGVVHRSENSSTVDDATSS